MRIVWKDSNARGYKPIKYRNQMVYGSAKGWTTDLPGDNNIYKSHYCALNAVDAALGGEGIRGKGTRKRQLYGIQIIGKKDDETA